MAIVAIAVTAGTARNTHAAGAAGAPSQIQLQKLGAATLGGAGLAASVTTDPNSEFDSALMGDVDADSGNDAGGDSGTNRSIVGAVTGHGRVISSSARAKSNPELGTHWQGLNFHDQRFANGGNQFSVEPPDQALCAGNGYVLEGVNDVAQVYDTAGHALLNGGNAVDLNTFFGYPAAIVRSGPNAGQRGPSITDPVCLYDAQANRFFFVVLTLDHVGLTAATNGNNHLDIAVSDTGNPTGSWTIYKLPVQNNGTQGTPNHNCGSGFCLGDYPHIGADGSGIYLTTNEFAFSGPGFYGSQIYAISKAQLVAGSASPTTVLFNTLGLGPDGGGFTVWPAQSPSPDNNGKEYFLSSRAVFTDDGTSDSILLWTLSNTASLDSASPSLALDVQEVPVQEYAVPPRATQKAGNQPLQNCLGDLSFACNTSIAGTASHNTAVYGGLNANDSRMQQVVYANGKVWGALDTAVDVGGQERAGIAYYEVNPNSGKIVLEGQLGEAGTDYTYPAIGVLPNGKGVMAFTLTGDNAYPSAAYTGIDAKVGAGDVHLAAPGVGAWDGFTQYRAFGAGRPRWGDYGAAAVMGNSIWIASEYVAQTCNYATYKADPTCGGTRAPLGNWSTHISQITP
ncbi:MAG TPA: hypothetical protein VI408_00475 [Gaiellaceae bacterium]